MAQEIKYILTVDDKGSAVIRAFEGTLSTVSANASTNLNNVTNKAKEQKVALDSVTTSVDKAKDATKKHADDLKTQKENMEAATHQTIQARQGLYSMTQIIQDAPYGIRGMANNIEYLGVQMTGLANQTDTVTGKQIGFLGAFDMMLGSITPITAGLLTFSTVMATIDYIWGNQKKKTEESTKVNMDYAKSLAMITVGPNVSEAKIAFEQHKVDLGDAQGKVLAYKKELQALEAQLKKLREGTIDPRTGAKTDARANEISDAIDAVKKKTEQVTIAEAKVQEEVSKSNKLLSDVPQTRLEKLNSIIETERQKYQKLSRDKTDYATTYLESVQNEYKKYKNVFEFTGKPMVTEKDIKSFDAWVNNTYNRLLYAESELQKSINNRNIILKSLYNDEAQKIEKNIAHNTSIAENAGKITSERRLATQRLEYDNQLLEYTLNPHKKTLALLELKKSLMQATNTLAESELNLSLLTETSERKKIEAKYALKSDQATQNKANEIEALSKYDVLYDQKKKEIEDRYAALSENDKKSKLIELYNYEINLERQKQEILQQIRANAIAFTKMNSMQDTEQFIEGMRRRNSAAILIELERSNRSIQISNEEAKAKQMLEYQKVVPGESDDARIIRLRKADEEYANTYQNNTVARENAENKFASGIYDLTERIKQSRMGAMDAEFKKLESTRKSEMESLKKALDMGIITQEQYAQAEVDLTEKIAKEKQEIELKYITETFSKYLGIASQVMSAYKGLSDETFGYQSERQKQFIDRDLEVKIQDIDQKKQRELDAISTVLEREDLSSARRKVLQQQQKNIEEKYRKEKVVAENEAAKKKYQVEVSQFRTAQGFRIAETIMNTAQAIVRGFADLGPIGGAIFAAVMGGIGIAQISAIAGQEPPPEPVAKFHEGGSFKVTGNRDQEAYIKVRGGEAGVVRTENQQQMNNAVNITININAIGTPVEVVKQAVEEGLKRTGQTVDKYFVNNNANVVFA